MADIVCIGAHPDDVEIGMGGTVASLVRRGVDVLILDLTDGEPTPHGTVERRAAEAAESAAVLGCRRVTLDLPNRYLFDTVEARQEVAAVLRVERPGLVFAPFPEDAHPDHIAASAIAQAARFFAKLTKSDLPGDPHYPDRLYHYMAVHARMVREPSFLADITAELPRKLEALACYRSQFADNPANSRLPVWVEQTARTWGAFARTEAAEPFFTSEVPVVASVLDLR